MLSKRPARVFAMQALYAMEISSRPLAMVLDGVLDANPLAAEQRAFGMRLLAVYQENHDWLKSEVEDLAKHWAFERMPTLDRIVLMLGMAELQFFAAETPVKVVISECSEISKKYSTSDSVHFVNGVLKGFAEKHQMLAAAKRPTTHP